MAPSPATNPDDLTGSIHVHTHGALPMQSLHVGINDRGGATCLTLACGVSHLAARRQIEGYLLRLRTERKRELGSAAEP